MIICSFWKNFKSFIKVKIKQQNWISTSFEKITQKVVNVEVKVDLKSSIMIWNANFYYSKHNYLSQNTFAKVQTQDSTTKNSKSEESKPNNFKPANRKTPTLSYTNK